MIVFKDDEKGYDDWLGAHPNGYVLNAKRTPTPTGLTLHLGKCQHLGTFGNPPVKMTSATIKICATERAELQRWAEREFPAPVQFKLCRDCNP